MSAQIPSFTADDHALLHRLREHRRSRRLQAPRVTVPDLPPRSMAAGIADAVARHVGSWPFLVIQSALLAGWIIFNAVSGASAWDPYPFILLNLLLSFQAAYTAPVIMMSQNRLSEIDRQKAEMDFQVNVKAELEIELLHQKIDLMREREILALTQAVTQLLARIEPKEA